MSETAHSHSTYQATEACPYCGHEITHTELVAIERRIEKEQKERFDAREKQLNAKHLAATSELHKEIASKNAAAAAKLNTEKAKHEKALAAKDMQAEKKTEAARKAERAKVKKENSAAQAKLAKERKAIETERKKLEAGKEVQEKAHQDALKQQRGVMAADTEKKLLTQKAESEKMTYRLTKKLEDMQRQLEKKSNEELGDGAEVDLFNELKTTFPDDVIIRVRKGVAGADIKHEVHVDGRCCGKIVYDSKNRNDWKTAYAEQLHKDQLAEKADHAILSTRKFPRNTRELTEYDGVLLVNPSRAVILARVLRDALVRLSLVKVSNQGKQEKKDKLYEFVTSSRCKNLFTRVEQEVTHLRDLDVTEKKQQEKMRKDRAKHVGEMEKTVLGDLQSEIHRIIGL